MKNKKAKRGFTLLEILMAIGISTIIAGAVFLALNTGLESWSYSKSQLSIQKVMNEVMDHIANGRFESYGLRDSLEIVSADIHRIDFVPPWTDDTHVVVNKTHAYTLNQRIKPGTALPIAEIQLPNVIGYSYVQVKRVDKSKDVPSEVILGFNAPSGSDLRFTFHPDAKHDNEVVKTFRWDPEQKAVLMEDSRGVKNISENSFGVKITDFKMKYFDNSNTAITDLQEVDEDELNNITGLEMRMEAELEGERTQLLTFINLRNAPLRLGYLPLAKDLEVKIPDSENIHTLQLSNIQGVDNEDVIDLELIPDKGDIWRIVITFSQVGKLPARIAHYEVEYPLGTSVFKANLGTDIDIGLDLLTLDAQGLYDYDDDQDIKDVALLKGDVVLKVKEMDIEGCGLFIKP